MSLFKYSLGNGRFKFNKIYVNEIDAIDFDIINLNAADITADALYTSTIFSQEHEEEGVAETLTLNGVQISDNDTITCGRLNTGILHQEFGDTEVYVQDIFEILRKTPDELNKLIFIIKSGQLGGANLFRVFRHTTYIHNDLQVIGNSVTATNFITSTSNQNSIKIHLDDLQEQVDLIPIVITDQELKKSSSVTFNSVNGFFLENMNDSISNNAVNITDLEIRTTNIEEILPNQELDTTSSPEFSGLKLYGNAVIDGQLTAQSTTLNSLNLPNANGENNCLTIGSNGNFITQFSDIFSLYPNRIENADIFRIRSHIDESSYRDELTLDSSRNLILHGGGISCKSINADGTSVIGSIRFLESSDISYIQPKEDTLRIGKFQSVSDNIGRFEVNASESEFQGGINTKQKKVFEQTITINDTSTDYIIMLIDEGFSGTLKVTCALNIWGAERTNYSAIYNVGFNSGGSGDESTRPKPSIGCRNITSNIRDSNWGIHFEDAFEWIINDTWNTRYLIRPITNNSNEDRDVTITFELEGMFHNCNPTFSIGGRSPDVDEHLELPSHNGPATLHTTESQHEGFLGINGNISANNIRLNGELITEYSPVMRPRGEFGIGYTLKVTQNNNTHTCGISLANSDGDVWVMSTRPARDDILYFSYKPVSTTLASDLADSSKVTFDKEGIVKAKDFETESGVSLKESTTHSQGGSDLEYPVGSMLLGNIESEATSVGDIVFPYRYLGDIQVEKTDLGGSVLNGVWRSRGQLYDLTGNDLYSYPILIQRVS